MYVNDFGFCWQSLPLCSIDCDEVGQCLSMIILAVAQLAPMVGKSMLKLGSTNSTIFTSYVHAVGPKLSSVALSEDVNSKSLVDFCFIVVVMSLAGFATPGAEPDCLYSFCWWSGFGGLNLIGWTPNARLDA